MWRSHFAAYQLATNVDILVANALSSNPPIVSFKRPLLANKRACWDGLVAALDGVVLRPEADSVSWALSRSGKFSVQSLYNKLTVGPTLDIARGAMESVYSPEDQNFPMGNVCDRLPSSNNIALRNGPSDGSCVLCGQHEDSNHIFFNCYLARFAWSAG